MTETLDKVMHLHRMKATSWVALFVGLTLLILVFIAASATARVVVEKGGEAADAALDRVSREETAGGSDSPFGPGVIS